MKSIVIYSSLTGNTERVARAIAQTLGALAVRYDDARADGWRECDLVVLACYIDRGNADEKMKAWMSHVQNKDVAVVFTLGADPNGQHARDCCATISCGLGAQGNRVVKAYWCQGAIAPSVIETIRKMSERLPDGHPHRVTAETEARWARASTHPDEADIAAACKAFAQFAN